MHVLNQAAILEYDNLVSTLKPHGYHPISYTAELWLHKTRLTTFYLSVDDFGIKYFNKPDINQLL